jgi:hypothetical protein
MSDEIGAVLLIPFITGLIEVFKRAGLPNRYAALAALVLGVAISVGAFVSQGFGAHDLYDAILRGAAFGLAASGLYSVARTAERSVRGGAIAQGREARR